MKELPEDRRWRNLGAREGLYVLVHSERGGGIRVATNDDANNLCAILNSLEESSAFGQQCYQDRCENAYVEASVVKKVEGERDALQAAIDGTLEFLRRSGDSATEDLHEVCVRLGPVAVKEQP